MGQKNEKGQQGKLDGVYGERDNENVVDKEINKGRIQLMK